MDNHSPERVHCTRCQILEGANAPAAPVLPPPLFNSTVRIYTAVKPTRGGTTQEKTHPTYVRIMGTLPYGIPFPFRRAALGPYKKDEVNIRLSLSHNERVQILSLAAAISPARPLYIYGVVLRSLQLND